MRPVTAFNVDMAGNCRLAGALLPRFAILVWAAYAAQTVAAEERRSSKATLARVHATSGAEAASLALHTHTLKAARLRGRLTSGRSSHGLRANVFRAASASTAHAKLQSHAELQSQQAPLYVPKMSLANITEPTPFPPPPPVLDPWKDHQPLDTAIGHFLISGFVAQPTVTPPPSQSSLDLAFACPALLTWPGEVSVTTPDPCGSMSTGNWTGKDGSEQIQWATSCVDTSSPGITPPSVSPVTTYTVGNGDLFGTSQVRQVWTGSHVKDLIELRDCGGATLFSIEEKIYKQAGKADPDVCKKHKSCDGILYFQYFMKNAAGKIVAITPYLTIFQESFEITDTLGGKIADVSRNGWEPDVVPAKDDCDNEKPRLWELKYAGSPPGMWASVPNQWPIAAMMTMIAQRDATRQPDGSVLWSNCEALKSTGYVLLSGVLLTCVICCPLIIFLVCSAPILRCLGETEAKLFPKRMGKPSMYSN